MPSPVDTSRHSCECACVHCEQNNTGVFAQRAALRGDVAAAAIFEPRLAHFLLQEAARIRARQPFPCRRAAR